MRRSMGGWVSNRRLNQPWGPLDVLSSGDSIHRWAVAAWEWGGLLGLGAGGRYLLAAAFAALCVTVALLAPEATGSGLAAGLVLPWVLAVHAVAALFWVAVVPFWLRARWP